MASAALNHDPPPRWAPRLRSGATLGLVAPASATTPENAASAVEALEALGFCIKIFGELTTSFGYLAGDDATRAANLNAALADPEVDAVLAVRGGYGVGRILDRIDSRPLAARPKIVAGFSDITALHAALWVRHRLVTFHSPNAVDGFAVGRGDPRSRAAMLDLLRGESLELGATGLEVWRRGAATGRLMGGNLAGLAALVGGPWLPDPSGCILVLEEVDEAPYRVDRMLLQLRDAGWLGGAAGVVLGAWTECVDRPGKATPTVEEVLREYLEPLGLPVLAGFATGHQPLNFAWPHGGLAELDGATGTLRLIEPPVT